MLLRIRSIAFYQHKRLLGHQVLSLKKQTYPELKRMIEESRLNGPNEEFAYARYLTATEFSKYARASKEPGRYRALREHMGLISTDTERDMSNPTGAAPGG